MSRLYDQSEHFDLLTLGGGGWAHAKKLSNLVKPDRGHRANRFNTDNYDSYAHFLSEKLSRHAGLEFEA